MNKILALVLAVVAVFAAYKGYQIYQEANAGFSILGVEVSASDVEATQQSYIYWGGALMAAIGALFFFRKG